MSEEDKPKNVVELRPDHDPAFDIEGMSKAGEPDDGFALEFIGRSREPGHYIMSTSYPGQPQGKFSEAPDHIVKHYFFKPWPLPFIEPEGELRDIHIKTRERLRPSKAESS